MTTKNRRERYTVGLVVTPDSGTVVVVEKRPREITRQLTTRERPRRTQDLSQRWEDVLELVAVERVVGRMVDVVDTISAALSKPPIFGDFAAYLESEALGQPIARLLGERGVHTGRIVLAPSGEGADAKTGEWGISLERLQNRISLAFETGRLVAAADLSEGQTTLHALERLVDLPELGAAREVGIAAAVAVWTADTRPTNGPWSSAFPPPADSPEARYFEEKDALRQLAAEQREKRGRGRGWARSMLNGRTDDDG